MHILDIIFNPRGSTWSPLHFFGHIYMKERWKKREQKEQRGKREEEYKIIYECFSSTLRPHQIISILWKMGSSLNFYYLRFVHVTSQLSANTVHCALHSVFSSTEHWCWSFNHLCQAIWLLAHSLPLSSKFWQTCMNKSICTLPDHAASKFQAEAAVLNLWSDLEAVGLT